MILEVSSNLDDSVILATHPCSAHSHWLSGAAEVLVSLSGSFRSGARKKMRAVWLLLSILGITLFSAAFFYLSLWLLPFNGS